MPPPGDLRLVAAYAIFFASYVVFAIGKFPGMQIDRPGAAIIGAVLMVAFRIVEPADALRHVDFSTIVLLFSMMLIVGYLHLAGLFEWITHVVVTRLRPHHLLPTVVFTSGVLSAFFVNDVVCLVMVPFVLTATRRMGVPPLPYLLAVATASNVGSVATITGNPQNMLIGSFSGIGYRDFLLHLGPVALAGLLLDWLLIRTLCLRAHATEPAVPAMDAPALVAATGAAVMLITRTRDPRLVYEEVDWGLLVFFAGLFVIVGGADNAGLTADLLGVTRRWNLHHVAPFTVVVAVLSNLVSNVPAVMLLKSVVPGFADPHTGWLVLAMASTLAGNLTITGSVANIIVAERAKAVAPIGFGDYLRVGLPLTAATLLVGSGWLWLVG